jgi:hypothetical protein
VKVAISGSRGFPDRDLVERVLERLIERQAYVLIGCGRTRNEVRCTEGVDKWAHEYLRRADPRTWDPVYAEWDLWGKRAGMIRNELMIHNADELIAFLAPGPPTPGTSNAIERAQRKGIPMHVYHEGRWVSVP